MNASDSDVIDRTPIFEIEVNTSTNQADRARTARQRAAETVYTPDYERPPARRPAGEREESFSAFGWLLDGATGLIGEIRHNDLGLPEEFWVHAYAARREGLLAEGSRASDTRRSTAVDRRTTRRQSSSPWRITATFSL